MSDYLSVSRLTQYLKLKFDRDPYLERVYVTGQISNFRKRPTHQYFSLKDDKAVIQATMWAGVFKQLSFELEEGLKINVVGRLQLYEPNGSYAIIIEKAEPDGIGALALQFEQLKKRLAESGYFDQRHKKPLPQFVSKIGVITSSSGAVVRDIITTISRRFPGVEVLVFPTKVQGDGAALMIAESIRRANERDDLDLLIVGRGGGSIEDLWAFNEAIVVEAIFESRLPVISSVGHETDTTLADFVADKRAATPTAAAELATPVTKADLLAWLTERNSRAYQASLQRITLAKERLERSSQSVLFRQPERLYETYVERLDRLTSQLKMVQEKHWQANQQRFLQVTQRLLSVDLRRQIKVYQEKLKVTERLLLSHMANHYDSQLARFEKAQDALLSLDTSRILKRGFAIVQKQERAISSSADLEVGDILGVTLSKGSLLVEVKQVIPENEE